MNVFQKPLVAGLNAIQLAVLMNDTSIMENLECIFEHNDLRRLLSDELSNGRRLLHYAIKYDHHTLVSTVLDHNSPESTPEPLSPHDFSVLVSFALIHGSNAQTKSAIVASKHVDLSKAGLHPDKNDYHDLLYGAAISKNNDALEKLVNFISKQDGAYQFDDKAFTKIKKFNDDESPISIHFQPLFCFFYIIKLSCFGPKDHFVVNPQ